MPVGALLLEVVEAALRVAAATRGLVDPTVGSALRALGYDRDFRLLPGSHPRAVRLVPAAGWRRVRVDRRRFTICVPRGSRLDLGAVAKAFSADRIGRLVRATTGANVLVGLGGDVAVAGAPDGGWPVGIADDHRGPATGPTVAIADGGLATSSNHRPPLARRRTGAPPHRPSRRGLARVARARRAARADRRVGDGDVALAGAGTMTPDWYVMRATGLVSLLFLTVVVALGVATSTRARPRGLPLYVTTTVHRNAAFLAVAFLGVHVVTAVLDPYAAVQLTAVLVPFSSRAPFWVGLGALAVDLIAALVVTSLVRRRLPYSVWRGIHWAAYAAWPLALAHGLGAGTDRGTGWMRAVDALCIGVVGGALAWRVSGLEKEMPRKPDRDRLAA